jgi:membrane protein implicated in regulation of membrane protease activity
VLGLYLLAAVLGAGLLLFTIVGDADHDGDSWDHGPGALLFGLFRPRNLIFFLATFGVTGALLTWLEKPAATTLLLSAGMGTTALALSYSVFRWLRRSESAIDALDDAELEGRTARVVLPLSPEAAGRVVCIVADREQYLTARLNPGTPEALDVGREVVIVRVNNGVAEVEPFDLAESK